MLSSLILTWQVSPKLTPFIKKSNYWSSLWKWLNVSWETHYYRQTVSLLDWEDITMSCEITASLLLLFTRPSLPPLVFVFSWPAASPFLLGRALWAASRFTAAMSPELIQQFLQATVSGLHDSQPPSVRISAVRAIWGWANRDFICTDNRLQSG